MESRRCSACGKAFRPHPQVPQQRYCTTPACQRERNPDYWREYRRTHPQYSERNRMQQGKRNDRRRERLIAKMDARTAATERRPAFHLVRPAGRTHLKVQVLYLLGKEKS